MKFIVTFKEAVSISSAYGMGGTTPKRTVEVEADRFNIENGHLYLFAIERSEGYEAAFAPGCWESVQKSK